MASRQPKLILRESCIDDLVSDWEVGSFLEVGAGTGYMTKKFLDKGYRGACYDLGVESTQMMKANLQPYVDRVAVLNDLADIGERKFDYLFAFEVLEHIENDHDALARWTENLKQGGKLLLTVPAHQRKFGKSDELVGHVRRYERLQMQTLLASAGFKDIRIWNYGFPITELTRTVSDWLLRRESGDASLSATERSVKSSYNRPASISRLISLFGEGFVLPFCTVQRWFYGKDYGDGLVVTALKN